MDFLPGVLAAFEDVEAPDVRVCEAGNVCSEDAGILGGRGGQDCGVVCSADAVAAVVFETGWRGG